MRPTDLTIAGWQSWLDKFKAAKPTAKPGAAIRIENTIFSTARYFGGMRYNGAEYVYFEPIDENQPPNANGTPYVAWLMVRDDFLRWLNRELRKGGAS